MAYREALITFLRDVSKVPPAVRGDSQILEYTRPNWTFHAKGLWVQQTNPDSSQSAFTLIGSSNFSHRSLNRDLENQLLVWTSDTDLLNRMVEERDWIFSPQYSQPVTLGKLLSQSCFRLPWYSRFLLPIFRKYM